MAIVTTIGIGIGVATVAATAGLIVATGGIVATAIVAAPAIASSPSGAINGVILVVFIHR